MLGLEGGTKSLNQKKGKLANCFGFTNLRYRLIWDPRGAQCQCLLVRYNVATSHSNFCPSDNASPT